MDTVLASEQYLQHHQDNHQELSPIDALLQFLAPPIEIFTHPDRSSLYDIWGLCANNKSRPKSSASSITTKFPTLDPPPSTVTSCEDSLDRSSQVLLYHYTADDATVQHSEELQELATLSMEMEARIDEFMAENSLPVTTKTGRFTLERKKKSDITSDNNNSSIDNNHGISNNTNRTCEASTASTSSTPTKRRVGRFIVTE